MDSVSTRLIELVPGTEPPLGFDRRVLARVRQSRPGPTGGLVRRRPLFAAAAGAAAVVALVFGSLGWFAGRNDDHSTTRSSSTALSSRPAASAAWTSYDTPADRRGDDDRAGGDGQR